MEPRSQDADVHEALLRMVATRISRVKSVGIHGNSEGWDATVAPQPHSGRFWQRIGLSFHRARLVPSSGGKFPFDRSHDSKGWVISTST